MPSGSILNGGFEEGVEDMPAAWQKFGGFLSRSAAFPRSGSFAGAFSSSTDSTKWVYEPLSVEPRPLVRLPRLRRQERPARIHRPPPHLLVLLLRRLRLQLRQF